ncbi:AbrB/MazE/SpoVT family DNA-binding domain-containing protein [Pseudohongiella spirulinae]|uniref:Transcriptional regulator/antitoxin, MazE n=1 Tax=Pseudohongiella spirulinae TaxID=1249552 RepID=A0A0S2KDJ9_9GAMM|nr:AbrB/MazE/SpoVT family DNA-binding domain-containing protein [Pseudohongiella spirulinae]ALO46390.1 Transcriptional regulator/antitoxin, MazE [Pseudohongiella spirulinae]
MQVSKWGNSLAIRIPASVSEVLQLKEGDDIEVVVAGTRTFEIRRQPSRDELMAQLKAYRGRLPADFIFDRDDANERGA